VPKLLVSAIMPVHNRPDFLAEAIESVLAQTCPVTELIVVDDGSTDGTREVLARYENRAVILRRPHRGQSAARNTGLERATGAYIAYLDSDDLWAPTKVETMLRVLDKRPQIGLVYSRTIELLSDGTTVVAESEPSTVRFVTSMHRAECLQTVGLFDEELDVFEGFDMWLRMCDHYRVLGLPEPLYYHRHHGANTTLLRTERMAAARSRILLKRCRRAVELGAKGARMPLGPVGALAPGQQDVDLTSDRS